MKSFKKVLTTGLVFLLSLALLAGCGSKGNADTGEDLTGTVIKMAGLDGGFGQDGWSKVAAAFEEQTGVKVELQFEKNIAEVLRPVITSGVDVPHLIYLSVGAEGGLTETMIKEDQLTALDDLVDYKVTADGKTVKEQIIPGFLDSLVLRPKDDGKLYLMPINYSPTGLFFNQGLFDEKGWTVPTTWDEMWELGDKAKAEGIALFTYPTTGYFDAFFSAVLNSVVGPETYTKLMNFDSEAWASDETKAAFEIVGKLADYTEENTVSNANGEGFTKNQQLVLDNKALFIPNGTWLPGEMKDAPRAEGFKWGMTSVPKYKDDAYASAFTEQMYIPVSTEGKELEAAKQFMAFAYSDEAAKIFYENGGAVMPTVNAVDNIAEDDENKVFYSIYDNGAKSNTVGFAGHEAVEGVDLTSGEGILYGTINSVVTKDKTVDEWHKEVVEAVKKIEAAK